MIPPGPAPRRLVSSGLLLGVWLGFAQPSLAQSADDQAAAEALFDQGLALLEQGSFAEACQRLEASQSIDPGVGTLLYLGECYEKLGKTASAWATFRGAASAASAAGQADRARVGNERAERLAPRLLQLRIQGPAEDIEGLELRRDGKPVPRALWGTPVPVDPGEHELELNAPGYESFRTTVTLSGEGRTETVQLPVLERAASAPPRDSHPGAAAPPGALAEDQTSASGSVQRTGGLVLAGLGVVGLGVGSYFGLRALSKNRQAEETCAGPRCTTAEGVELTNEALSAARTSNVAFIAGGALLAGGLVLYLTAPQQQEVTRLELSPTVGGGQLRLGGSF